MEMVATTPNGTGTVPAPFQRRDVEEWSGLNRLTGMLEHARVETDHWAAKTSNSVHNYGKVIDSRNQCTPDGNNQQKARRQLEVFQAKVPGGSVQVIRTQTSSSSRWSSGPQNGTLGFQDLKLALNPLDTSSQKTKATVGRSGSIGARRPPSRPHSTSTADSDVTARLARVSRLCQQLHNETRAHTTPDNYSHRTPALPSPFLDKRPSTIRKNNSPSPLNSSKYNSHAEPHNTPTNTPPNPVNILKPRPLELSSARTLTTPTINTTTDSKSDTALETDRRLHSALRTAHLDLEALDQILNTISCSSSAKSDVAAENDVIESSVKAKRHSFITVESLKEVRGRLRRLSPPVDDGIAEPRPPTKATKVRSYVYGMEALLHTKPALGTGSLESRTSSKATGSNCGRSEEWYNRRKSYGFENVHNQQISGSSCGLRNKNKLESSTDSGICRSTEIVVPPPLPKPSFGALKPPLVPYSTLNTPSPALKAKSVSTVVNLTSIPKNDNHELFNVWNRINDKDSQQTTIKIPLTAPINSKDTPTSPYQRQVYAPEGAYTSSATPAEKRHSIAVDELKYVHRAPQPANHRRTSLAFGDTYDLDELVNNSEKKAKRVEFCKTEVHFAAESGRVNIVETDEKPPPTQNFRRRRRPNSTITNNHIPDALTKTGLPLIHFGDTTYEKRLFGVPDDPAPHELTFNSDGHEVTISTTPEGGGEATSAPRSILKNKVLKPTPYILGGGEVEGEALGVDDNIWGVRLRPVYKEVASPPVWTSVAVCEEKVATGVNFECSRAEEVGGGVLLDLRSSWSVADRVKGFSTKVNFGSGEATVVQSRDARVGDWSKPREASITGFQSADQVLAVKVPGSKPVESIRKKNLTYPGKEIETSFQMGQKHQLLSRNEVLSAEIKPQRKLGSPLAEKRQYGAQRSPKPVKTSRIWNKPDLLQHYTNRDYVNLTTVTQTAAENRGTLTKRPDSPAVQRSASPIYENIDDVLSGLHSGLQQESAILEELTRAADQILQAVNGYTDEDSTSGDDATQKHRLNLKLSPDLSTIKETKPLGGVVVTRPGSYVAKTRKPSVESLRRDGKPVALVGKLSEEKNRKKMTGSSSEVTRARRLQRASSREALLQAHGSSSEDITTSGEVRKPRVTRKVKVSADEGVGGRRRSSAALVGLELKKSSDGVTGAQEIRHKTAVSTIRSTAEKARGGLRQSVEVRKRVTVTDTRSGKGNTLIQRVGRGGVSVMGAGQVRGDAVRVGPSLGVRGAKRQGVARC